MTSAPYLVPQSYPRVVETFASARDFAPGLRCSCGGALRFFWYDNDHATVVVNGAYIAGAWLCPHCARAAIARAA